MASLNPELCSGEEYKRLYGWSGRKKLGEMKKKKKSYMGSIILLSVGTNVVW
jgi:hypothetical protein